MQKFTLIFIVGSMYTNTSVGESMYEGSLSIENGLDHIEDVLMPHSHHQGALQGVPSSGGSSQQGAQPINPIDKLYSMQSSYFNGEWSSAFVTAQLRGIVLLSRTSMLYNGVIRVFFNPSLVTHKGLAKNFYHCATLLVIKKYLLLCLFSFLLSYWPVNWSQMNLLVSGISFAALWFILHCQYTSCLRTKH